jgi:hypothetical protein
MIKTLPSLTLSSVLAANRRRTPRIEVLGQIHGLVVTLDLAVRILDLGAGGFAVESHVPFPVGAVHDFRFTTWEGRVVLLAAEAVHRRRSARRSLVPIYITGFEFLRTESPLIAASIERLLESLTPVTALPTRH